MAIYTDYTSVEKTNTDAAAINNAIRNILLTPIGSMPGKPTFGSKLYELPFSQMDVITIDRAKLFIKEALKKWETRVIVDRITFEEVPEYNRLIATIYYSYIDKNLEINENVSINLTQ